MSLRVLFEDAHLIAIDKPAATHVHPPEDRDIRVPFSETCLGMLKQQTGRYLYPLHRLDYATSGVLLFAFDEVTAGIISRDFREQLVEKTYYCVARGWVGGDLTLDRPLGTANENSPPLEACTLVSPLARIELPEAVGKHSTARYSLVKARPLTGRMHQIRRHLAHANHPIVGDVAHGDRHHNHFFRDRLMIPNLLLKAHAMVVTHPVTREKFRIESRWDDTWHRLFELFGLCPYSK